MRHSIPARTRTTIANALTEAKRHDPRRVWIRARGFAIMELANVEEAVALCQPYAEILGGNLEIDVRLVDQENAS